MSTDTETQPEYRLIELRAENFKRLSACRIRPHGNVTNIIGKNGAGKTSVLDAIAAALGGSKQQPEMAIRKGRKQAEVIVDLGEIIVERRWNSKGSDLIVKPKGWKRGDKTQTSPQRILDQLYSNLTFDPLAFDRMEPKEQAATLARIAGVDLVAYKANRDKVYEQRKKANADAELASRQLDGIPVVDAPDKEESLSAIVEELDAANKKHLEYGKLHTAKDAARIRVEKQALEVRNTKEQIEELQAALIEREKHFLTLQEENEKIKKMVEELETPPDIPPIKQRGKDLESLNAKVRAKKLRSEKVKQVGVLEDIARKLTKSLEKIDEDHQAAIAAAKLPIEGLSFTEDGITLNGIAMSQCSSREKITTSTMIAFGLNPKLRIALIRDGSLLDEDGRKIIAEIAEKMNAQVFVEMVDTGREVGVMIVDGEGDSEPAETSTETQEAVV